jgi:hypothetical protein
MSFPNFLIRWSRLISVKVKGHHALARQKEKEKKANAYHNQTGGVKHIVAPRNTRAQPL